MEMEPVLNLTNENIANLSNLLSYLQKQNKKTTRLKTEYGYLQVLSLSLPCKVALGYLKQVNITSFMMFLMFVPITETKSDCSIY